jgi:hypothetical protein
MAFHEELESEGFDTSSFTCSFMLENAVPKKAEPFQDNVNRGCEARFTNANDMTSHFCLGDGRMCVKLLLVELALRTAKDHRERVKEVSARDSVVTEDSSTRDGQDEKAYTSRSRISNCHGEGNSMNGRPSIEEPMVEDDTASCMMRGSLRVNHNYNSGWRVSNYAPSHGVEGVANSASNTSQCLPRGSRTADIRPFRVWSFFKEVSCRLPPFISRYLIVFSSSTI